MSKPIQFISIDSDGKCLLNPEAEAFINQLDKNIAVICVAGLYRTGKSYLLNRILDRQSGFEIGSTIKSCTKGIWLWNEPLSIKNMDVLVIDTEGLGSAFEDRNQSIDMVIFCLAVLLSSYFIYNSMKNIDEASLESLSLVVNFAKKLQTELNQVENYINDFPAFLWVIRDFALNLQTNDGLQITPKQYLENALNVMSEDKDSSTNISNNMNTSNNSNNLVNSSNIIDINENLEKKNETRRLIKLFFKERDCRTVIRPVSDDKKLRIIDKLPEEELRPEFLKQMKDLIAFIFKGIKPKVVQGTHMNGEMFIGLVKNYIKALNNNCLPDVKSSLKIVVDSQVEQINNIAFNKFLDSMLDLDYKTVNTYEELFTYGNKAKKEAFYGLKQLLSLNIPSAIILDSFNKLELKVDDQFNDLITKWKELSLKQCSTASDNIIKEFSENNDESIDVLTILEVLGEVQQFIEESVSNNKKYEVIYPRVLGFFSDQIKKTYTEYRSKVELEINGLKAEKDSLQNIVSQTKKLIEFNREQYEKEINKSKEEMQQMRLGFEERVDEKNKLIKSIQLSNENTIEDLKGNIENLKQQIEQKNKDFFNQSKLSKTKGSLGGGGGNNYSGGNYSDTIIEGIMTRLDLFKDSLLKSEIDKARMMMKQEISYRIEDMQEEFQKKISQLRKEMEKLILKVKAESKREMEEYKQIIKVKFFHSH